MKRIAGVLISILLSVPATCVLDGAFSSEKNSQAQQDSKQSQNANEQSKKQKRKGKKSIDNVTDSATFSDAVAQSLVQKLADGLEGYSDRSMLSAFDQGKMEGFVTFQQQVVALFRRSDSFRVHFRIVQTSTEGGKGVAFVEFEMEMIPRTAEEQPLRKRDQLRFEMEHGDKGWRIVDVQPRSFFS